MIFNITPDDMADARRLMTDGALTEADRFLRDSLLERFNNALGERDALERRATAWEGAFDRYLAEVREIARPTKDGLAHERGRAEG
jgi:hypothetical protein